MRPSSPPPAERPASTGRIRALFSFRAGHLHLFVLGLAVAFSHVYPRWLGWTVFLAGVLSIGAGLIQAYVGEPTGASRVLTIIGPSVITLWLLVMGVLLLRFERERPIEPT